MFSLSERGLAKKIVGCADGLASFNCELTREGGAVVSVDPIYRFSEKEIEERIEETYATVLDQARANNREFVWTKIKSPEELGSVRLTAVMQFVCDYTEGKERCRYVSAKLPVLPFSDKEFEFMNAA